MEERLRKFARLVDAGSFTKAAETLHVSQPALSVAVSKLERELRAPLLVRGSRTLALTPAGHAAYAAAKDVGARTANLTTELAALANQPQDITIGMIDSVAETLFASADTFETLEQHDRVTVSVNNSSYLLRSVAHDELDLAFVVAPKQSLPQHVVAVDVGAEPFVVVCHQAQKAATETALQNGRLPRFISYDRPSNTCALVQKALENINVTPEYIFYSTSPEVMLQLVLQQKGAAALPFRMVSKHLQSGALMPLHGSQPIVMHRPIAAVHRNGKVLAPTLTSVIDHLRNSFVQLQSEAHVRI